MSKLYFTSDLEYIVIKHKQFEIDTENERKDIHLNSKNKMPDKAVLVNRNWWNTITMYPCHSIKYKCTKCHNDTNLFLSKSERNVTVLERFETKIKQEKKKDDDQKEDVISCCRYCLWFDWFHQIRVHSLR